MTNYHTPVLGPQVLSILDIKPGKIYIDATLGNGGHSLQILKKGGVVYGIDQDPTNLSIAIDRIKKAGMANRFYPIHDNFSQLCQIIKTKIKKSSNIRGLLFDLGLSINQQKSSQRGFSFNDTQSLDMRLDPTSQTITGESIINTAPYQELVHMFSFYAQEKYCKPISLKIISQRKKTPIKTAKQLSEIINGYYQQKNIKSKLNPSTKIFMALRITVNQEMDNLKTALSQSLSCLPGKSIVAILSFHSGEDRIVKQFIKNNTKKLQTLTPKPIRSNPEEIQQNPLSRSTLLRAFQIK